MSGPYAWLQENPSVRDTVLAEADLGGKALPDALLADPLKLLELGKAVVIEAVRRDAPEGVVEGLMVPVRRLRRFGSQIDRYAHVTTTLSEAQGLRDKWEFEPVLAEALRSAPDEANEQAIQRMLDVLDRPDSVDGLVVMADDIILGPDGGATELSPGGQCALCCGLACLLCELGCLACCVVGCVACGS